ncbi:MAG: hypothetical protein ACJARD_001688 [Alphaproteobacteria bacterium]|jgi:hypothetical protein
MKLEYLTKQRNYKAIYRTALLVFAFTFGLFYMFLMYQHPHEDAYILFIYVKNFVAGHGISYFAGAEPAEGATDFLWFMLISLGHWLGFYPAIAAALINALSAGVIFMLIASILKKHLSLENLNIYHLAVIALCIIISPVFTGSIYGFSVYFYAAAFLFLFYVIAYAPIKYLVYIPLIGVMIALIRPDGVMPSIAATLTIFVYIMRHHKELVKPYFKYSVIALVIGACYFIGRYHYFGLLFPLPIYVKSTSTLMFPGMETFKYWCLNSGILLILLSTVFLEIIKPKNRVLLGLIPPVILLVSFLFFVPSQNESYRFQNATYFIFITFFISLIFDNSFIKAEFHKKIYLLNAILFLLFIASNIDETMHEINDTNINPYIEVMSYHLNKDMPDDMKTVLTEAGLFTYWGNGEFYDVIGLNTPETAINGPSAAWVARTNPDLLFFHTAGHFKVPAYITDQTYYHLSNQEFRDIYKRANLKFNKSERSDTRGAAEMLKFLNQNSADFSMVIVPYHDSTYHNQILVHFYAVRKTGKLTFESVIRAIKKSHQSRYHYGYLALERKVSGKLLNNGL